MSMSERYLIDTDVLVAGEHTPEIVAGWIESKHDVATCDVVRAEFLVGVHAPSQAATREKARRFYDWRSHQARESAAFSGRRSYRSLRAS
jgi:predicted nucleic acid-binding protein